MELNKIYNENCLNTMARMPDGFVDLVVTSPPYDGLRKYNGYSFDFESVAKELFRVVNPGGVVVWVVADETVDGGKTGTSLKHCLGLQANGFNIHDYMIYEKNSPAFPAKRSGKRYSQTFEFVFIMSKGCPKAVNLICDKKNKWGGFSSFDGKIPPVPDISPRNTIWRYVTSFNDQTNHPAVFPEQLAADHIYSWSNEGDLVYDPFGGSGTTAKMAHLQKRYWIMSEISGEYCELSRKRIEPYLLQGSLFTSYNGV